MTRIRANASGEGRRGIGTTDIQVVIFYSIIVAHLLTPLMLTLMA
eukprot:UN25500